MKEVGGDDASCYSGEVTRRSGGGGEAQGEQTSWNLLARPNLLDSGALTFM